MTTSIDKLIGERLTVARDHASAMSDYGVANTRFHAATGEARSALLSQLEQCAEQVYVKQERGEDLDARIEVELRRGELNG